MVPRSMISHDPKRALLSSNNVFPVIINIIIIAVLNVKLLFFSPTTAVGFGLLEFLVEFVFLTGHPKLNLPIFASLRSCLFEEMRNIVADEYPPFTLEKARYNQVSCYQYIMLA